MLKRVYQDSRTAPFSVRVRESEVSSVTRLASRHGIDPVQARRRVVELGIVELEKELNAA